QWKCQLHYRLELEDFGHTTEALATPDKRVERDHKWIHIKNDIAADAGDCIILTTDALARWILSQMKAGEDPWTKLLSISDANAFKRFVRFCRSTGAMETDDTTIMIIPVHTNIMGA